MLSIVIEISNTIPKWQSSAVFFQFVGSAETGFCHRWCHLRRWSSIVQMVYKCFVFSGIQQATAVLSNSKLRSSDDKTALGQNCVYYSLLQRCHQAAILSDGWPTPSSSLSQTHTNTIVTEKDSFKWLHVTPPSQKIQLCHKSLPQKRWIERALQLLNWRFFLSSQKTQNVCITFIQRRPNVFDVGPTLYKCYTNVLCLPGCDTIDNRFHGIY